MSKFATIQLAHQINLRAENEGDSYYRIKRMRQLDSNSICFLFHIEEIAHRDACTDTIEEIEDGELEQYTFYPIEETLKDLLQGEGYEILDDDFNPSVLSLNGNAIQLSEI